MIPVNPFQKIIFKKVFFYRSSKEKRKMLRHHLRGSNLDKVPRHFDVICIGSGLGSLTTAAMLAKTGGHS